MDESADIIIFVRMDAAKKIVELIAPKMAYTSAIYKRNTSKLRERHNSMGFIIGADFSTDYTPVPGGNVIVDPDSGAAIGAIGVSGRPTAEDDKRLALIRKKAAKDYLRQSS